MAVLHSPGNPSSQREFRYTQQLPLLTNLAVTYHVRGNTVMDLNGLFLHCSESITLVHQLLYYRLLTQL